MCIAIAVAAGVVWIKQELARMVQPDMPGAQSVTGTRRTREKVRGRGPEQLIATCHIRSTVPKRLSLILWLNLGQRPLHCPHRLQHTAHFNTLVTFAELLSRIGDSLSSTNNSRHHHHQ